MAQGTNELLLTGINLAVLVMDGFEAKEFFEPLHALEEAGATVSVISACRGKVQAFENNSPAKQVETHSTFDEADPQEFVAALLPGGEKSTKAISAHPKALQFLSDMCEMGKPVAAISHGVALLAEADAIAGRSITGHPGLKETAIRAKGNWKEVDVIVDGSLVTARGKADLPAFIEAMLLALHAYVHQHVAGTRDERADIGPGS